MTPNHGPIKGSIEITRKLEGHGARKLLLYKVVNTSA